MPKKQAQRRIDKTAGSGARTITVTGGSTGGSGGVGQHSLSGSHHTGVLAIAQAPWAVTDSEFTAHTANANAHHNRRHSITSTSDHSVTADAYALLGATNTDTLGLLYIASSGDGIDVSKSSATFTFAVDVSDFDGAGLGDDGSNNLYVKTAEGVTLNGDNVTVDEAYDFAWTGDHTHASTVGSPTFSSGFAGSGWRIDTDDASLTLDDLTVRGRLSVYEMLIRQIRATNGNVFVSDSAKIETVSGSGPYTLSVASGDVHGFAVGDLIRAQRFTGAGVYQSNMQVTSVTDTQTFVATLTSGDNPAAGMDFVRLGSTSDSDRRGSIYLSSADTYAPYIDIIDGVDAFGDWNTSDVLKVRMGNLAGITDPDFGVLSGSGMYVKGGGYFKGDVAAASADVVLNTYGLNLAAGGESADNTGPSAISWTSTPLAPTAATLTGHISSSNYDASGTVYNRMTIGVPFGTTTLTDEALMGLYVTSSDDSGDNLYFLLETTGTINGGAESWSGRRAWLGADNFFVQSRTVAAGDVVPFNDGVFNLGTASSRWGTLYVDEIVAGTTSSTDTGHNHDDRYYTQAQIDNQATGYAASSHTHASYINSTTLTSTLSSYVTSAALTTTLADYYTESETDTLLSNKSSTGHTHDDRYYTESEVNSLLGSYSAMGHTHDDRYYTETEVDNLLAAGVTAAAHDVVSTHSVTAAQYAVLSTWGAADTLSMVTATDDGTAGHKLLKSDANGDLTLNDLTFADATISGVISSSDYVAGSAGFYIDSDRAEFGALRARGAFQSAVFEVDSTAVFSSRQLIVKSSGTLRNSIAIDTSGGVEHQLDIEFPTFGEHPIAVEGDVLRIRGLASYTAPTSSGNSTTPVWEFWAPQVLATGVTPADVWLTVTGINRAATHYTYTCDWESGSDNVTLLAGEAVAVYGQSGDGVIESVATGAGAPYINIATHSGSPWIDAVDHVRIGQLGGITPIAAAANEWGIAAGTLTSSSGAYIVISDQQAVLHSVPFLMTDSTGNTTGSWNQNGIAMVAPLSMAYQLPGEEAIGGGAPDDEWYAPAYSSLNWSTDPDSTSPNDEYGAVRMMTQRTQTAGFGTEGYDSITRLEMLTRGQRLIAGDNLITESAMGVESDDGLSAEFMLRSYQYSSSSSTEARLTAGRFYVSGSTTFAGGVTLSSNLTLRNFATSEADVAIGQIYVDGGTLKIKTA